MNILRIALSLLLLNTTVSLAQISHSVILESKAYQGYKIAETKSVCFASINDKPIRFEIVEGIKTCENKNLTLVSLESVDMPGYFIRHQNYNIKLHPYPENDDLFAKDATYILTKNTDGTLSFESYNYRNHFITVTQDKKLRITPDVEPKHRSFSYIEYTK